ncbi:hypothetical protein BDW69DRAFT_194080 [Aspergillus filifer]
MQVLAVGISRSGTESLREALHILGYDHTHHGFDTILPPYDLENMYRLLKKKYKTPPAPGATPGPKLTAEDFDTILGHSVGVCDLTAAEFAPELIAAYPDAKSNVPHHDADFLPRQFRNNGKWVYEQHVAMIRGLGLPSDRMIEWSVEDGWEPPCAFLGKEVPDVPFPNGNPPQAWAERIALTTKDYHRKALRNMLIWGAVVVGLTGVAVARRRGWNWSWRTGTAAEIGCGFQIQYSLDIMQE